MLNIVVVYFYVFREDHYKGSQASLNGTLKLPSESDDDNEFGEYEADIDTGKFNEDGSFIGKYVDSEKRTRAAMDSTV